MTIFIHRAIITDILDNTILTKDFLRMWQAKKWAYKIIDRHKKQDEWYVKFETHFKKV